VFEVSIADIIARPETVKNPPGLEVNAEDS